MFKRPAMALRNAGIGSATGFNIIRGMGLVLIPLICLIMLLFFNLRTAAAADCVCISCHGENHHGENWATCQTCHLSPPQTGAHLQHSATLSNSTYGDTITSTAGEYRFGCGHCHPLDYSRHNNGTKDIELYNPNPVATGRTGTQVCSDCHGVGPHGTSCDFNDCTTCHSTAQGSSPAIIPASNHHAGACATCHYADAVDGRAPHDKIKPLATNASCAVCHSESLTNMNHPVAPQTPATCLACHVNGGIIPPVQTACGGCHDGTPGPAFSVASLLIYAADMHNTKPHANFNTNVNYSASYTLDFSAAASTCPSGYSCTFSWDFDNDGLSDASGSIVTYTFAGTGPYPVTLKVTTNSNASDSITKNVTPVVINQAPTVCSTDWNFNSRTVSFDDCSTDDGEATIYVNWGDGRPVQSYALGQQDITYTYTLNSTYHVSHWVQDDGGFKASEPVTVVIPTKRRVSVTALGDGTGEVAGAPLASALVRVYKAGTLKAQGYTSSATGTYTSPQIIEPGAVTISIMRSGKTFNCDETGSGTNVPVANLTATTDGSVSCTY